MSLAAIATIASSGVAALAQDGAAGFGGGYCMRGADDALGGLGCGESIIVRRVHASRAFFRSASAVGISAANADVELQPIAMSLRARRAHSDRCCARSSGYEDVAVPPKCGKGFGIEHRSTTLL